VIQIKSSYSEGVFLTSNRAIIINVLCEIRTGDNYYVKIIIDQEVAAAEYPALRPKNVIYYLALTVTFLAHL